jgi:hypothetical protein
MVAGYDDTLADEDDLREAAAAYTLERREFLVFGGECAPCKERYLANCKLLGIER